jgi:Icc-related predicted phosphoesterase
VFYIPGNHDIGQVPNKKSINKYRKNYGNDRFSFKHKNSLFIGINSGLIKASLKNTEKKQYKWLVRQLEKGKEANQVVVFCHYPFFNKTVNEPEAYSNIGPEARLKYLDLFQEYGVDAVFAGHYHNNALNTYKKIELITTSAVGKPLGKAPSGLRIIKVENDNLSHEYFGLEEVPENLSVN